MNWTSTRENLIALSLELKAASVASVAARFKRELQDIVMEALDGNGKITRDMRPLVRQAVESAYSAGLANGGHKGELTDAMQREVNALVNEQLASVSGFSDDVRLAMDEQSAEEAVLGRVDLWAQSIEAAGQAGWTRAKAQQKKRLQWHTARDELTCPVCAPLNNKIVMAGQAFGKDEEGVPIFHEPAHLNCRCTTTEYIP